MLERNSNNHFWSQCVQVVRVDTAISTAKDTE